MTLTTPALLFPAISLLFLAYNNRFLTLAQLIRSLHAEYTQKQNEAALAQIRNMRRRLRLIQAMEFLGVLSFVVCVFCMLVFMLGSVRVAESLLVVALVSLGASLMVALAEVHLSIGALRVLLSEVKAR